jgi:plasmid stabilization system protein ParE
MAVKTESEHSLHQAKKYAAQSTVILVALKRDPDAAPAFDRAMQAEIRQRAESARIFRRKVERGRPARRIVRPALEVYSRFAEVRTDTGERVGVIAPSTSPPTQ